MRAYVILLLVLATILGLVMGCGCSLMTAPAYGYVGDAQDTWPCFFGTDGGAVDNGYMLFYDQNAAAWQAPRLIAADLLQFQWTPQRNGIGWSTGGVWNVSFIEDTSNDLEIWESPDAGWQDDAGAWGLLDDDASENWEAVDMETRQNYVWGGILDIAGPGIQNWYIDLAAGVPAFTNAGGIIGNSTAQYSIVLDDNLYGATHIVYIDVAGNLNYEYVNPPAGAGTGAIIVIALGDSPAYPQIIADSENRLWTFYTTGNVLYIETSFDIPDLDNWRSENTAGLYTATALTDSYHATWMAFDDTIHVVLVDFISEGATTLRYTRRTPNGWSAPVTLLTVDSTILGDHETIVWPQITVDTIGNIMVYYILGDLLAGNAGDLQAFYLDVDDYSNPIVGNWTNHVNIDGSGTDVVWVIAPDSIIIASDM